VKCKMLFFFIWIKNMYVMVHCVLDIWQMKAVYHVKSLLHSNAEGCWHLFCNNFLLHVFCLWLISLMCTVMLNWLVIWNTSVSVSSIYLIVQFFVLQQKYKMWLIRPCFFSASFALQALWLGMILLNSHNSFVWGCVIFVTF